MEPGVAVFENPLHPDALPDANSPFKSECLPTALELLAVLRQEAEILRRFAGAELLELVPKKEYLVCELEWKLKSADLAELGSIRASDSFKALLDEISKLNTSNGVFIEKSLSYWEDLLSIFMPPSYGPTGKAARRPPGSLKGMAFRREI
jgi:flagellar biosynthesis/type III secretory pathway chaperone